MAQKKNYLEEGEETCRRPNWSCHQAPKTVFHQLRSEFQKNALTKKLQTNVNFVIFDKW